MIYYIQLNILLYVVNSMGSSAYDIHTVGKPAKHVFSLLLKLGARPLVTAKSSTKTAGVGKKSKSLMIGDSEVGDADIVFEKWLNGIVGALDEGEGSVKIITRGKKKYTAKTKEPQVKKESDCACKEGNKEASTGCCSKPGNTKEEQGGCCSNNDEKNENGSSTDSLSDEDDDDDQSDIVDLEDMGDIMNEQNLDMKSSEPKEMVTKKQAKASSFIERSISTIK